MGAARHGKKDSTRAVHVHDKVSVFDTVLAFISDDERGAGRGKRHFRDFSHHSPRTARMTPIRSVQVAVHRIAAYPHTWYAGLQSAAAVGRTMPHLAGEGEIRAQMAFNQVTRVDIVRPIRYAELKPASYPRNLRQEQWSKRGFIRRNTVLVISGVHEPRATELFHLAQALDS